MFNWQRLAELSQKTESFVLVTVFSVSGSSPRESGAKMAVFTDHFEGTIGGGNLEHQAIKNARQILFSMENPSDHKRKKFQVEKAPLTPKFDQCCGGLVTIVYERINSSKADWFSHLETTLLDNDQAWLVTEVIDQKVKRFITHEKPATQVYNLVEKISSEAISFVIFGAGHVGKALVQNLQWLDSQITWMDQREAEFPAYIPSNVVCNSADDWQEVIDNAAPNSYFLVLTHSHQLDFSLTHAILKKQQFEYFGLIGSLKKKQRFERQLLSKKISESQLSKMTCPIGLPSIIGKSPEIIAASVTAQILQIYTQKKNVSNNPSKINRSMTRQQEVHYV